MEPNEYVRQTHRPDWLPVFCGTLMTFALMGVLSMIGVPLGLLSFNATDSLPWMVIKLLLDIALLVSALYAGGFVAGITMASRSRVAAVMNGFLVWELTAICFGVVGWFGYAPIPGIYFTHGDAMQAGPGILWMTLSFLIPIAIPAAYGAAAGNDHVFGEEMQEEADAREMYERHVEEQNRRRSKQAA